MTLHCGQDVSRTGVDTHRVSGHCETSSHTGLYSLALLANWEILLLLEILDLSLTWNYNKHVHMTCFPHCLYSTGRNDTNATHPPGICQ